MPYEDDPEVLAWLERSLGDRRPMVRRRALELLEYVDCPLRERWLARGERDADPRVASTAVLVGVLVRCDRYGPLFDLLESDFFEGRERDDLEWEWEYVVRFCREASVSSAGVTVWTGAEDDEAARRIALLKLSAGGATEPGVVAVIVGKRVVTRYTRSPRSRAEAAEWLRRGRPRYAE